MSSNDYPPYVDAYGSIGKLFDAIKKAAVPPKFTQDFVASILGLKSTSYRAMIPLLKKLGFLDQSNIPLEPYKQYRDESSSGRVLAHQIKYAYADLYKTHEYAEKLDTKELQAKLRSILGVAEDDQVVPKVANTFKSLAALADFTSAPPKKQNPAQPNADPKAAAEKIKPNDQTKNQLGISYTINLNLPATTEIDVFNAIFKSLKEHLLD